MRLEKNVKLGDGVLVDWEKREGDGLTKGITRGAVLGIAKDKYLGDCLVLDKNTHEGLLKSNILSLGIFDLAVIPMNCIKHIGKGYERQMPPGFYGKFTMKVEAGLESNIEFRETWDRIQKRNDCKPDLVRSPSSDAEYQIVIKEISSIEGASINVYSDGQLQISCKLDEVNKCIEWVKRAAALPSDHKRLVLFTTKHMYRIWSTFNEKARPTKEFIDRLATLEKGPSKLIFPIGWAHYYFVDLDENPLQNLFPRKVPLEKFIMKDKRARSKSKNKKKVSSRRTFRCQKCDMSLSTFPRSIRFCPYCSAPLLPATH